MSKANDLTVLPPDFEKLMRAQLSDSQWLEFRDSLELSPVRGAYLVSGKVCTPCPVGEEIPGMQNAWYLEPNFKPSLDPGWHTGAYYSQEPSAMFPIERFFQSLGDFGGFDLILDLCAAPGGKAIQLSKFLRPQGCLLANEVVRRRASILRENLTRAGVSQVAISSVDSTLIASRLPRVFQVVLVDAPCSGEGLFRKKPSSRKFWSLGEAESCAKRQKRILKNAWQALAPGGYLIYCTCTFNDLENEKTLEEFLSSEGGSLLESQKLWPHRFRGEGQFYAFIKKPGELVFQRSFKLKARLPKSLTHFLSESVLSRITEGGEVREVSGELLFEPRAIRGIKGIPLLARGFVLGSLLGRRAKELRPSHALAMKLREGDFGSELNLSQEEALSILKGEDPQGCKEGQGWVLMTFAGQGLGWGKRGADSKVRNRLPKGWRLRA
jgi:NOL1/NOP2/fmu family ribosome biogenesis protein